MNSKNFRNVIFTAIGMANLSCQFKLAKTALAAVISNPPALRNFNCFCFILVIE